MSCATIRSLTLLSTFAVLSCSSMNGVETGPVVAIGGSRTTESLLNASVKIEDSEFEKEIAVTGIEIAHGYYLGVPQPYMIRSWINKDTGVVRHQLYVVDTYSSDWIFWNSASDEDAQNLEFVSISREVGRCSVNIGCLHIETYGVSLPDSKLRARATSGYRIKVRSKVGKDEILTVSPGQISSQFAVIDERLRRLKSRP